ncbi:putative pectinesterase/pectinesterase inhibitor 6 [Drosera capensis]
MDTYKYVLVSLFTFALLAFVLHGSPISSCAQTPYPSICNNYMASGGVILNPEIFRDKALSVTRNQAQAAHQLISSMAASSLPDQRTRMVWADCVELYEDSLYHLNKVVPATSNHDDVQTYLSAAIANQETCENGFLGLNSPFPQMLMSNFSMLLSNALAINKATGASTEIGGGRRLLEAESTLPSWLSATHHRQLLQTGADMVVAKDGTGDFKTISEALVSSKLASGTSSGKRFVLYVKHGVYNENVVVKRTTHNLVLIGDGIGATVVTGDKNVQGGSTTFRSATFAVSGSGFMARDITFQNTAGPAKHQAVAFRSGADFSVYYRCQFIGYQDTLYVYAMRQFFRDCEIYGTVDFIFGDAVAVFQNCNIFARKPLSNQFNTVTAQGRKDPNENTGIVIQNSHITAAPDLKAVQGSYKTYLGRPWQQYSRTIIIKSVLDSLIAPQGWLPWSGSFALSTLTYAEYMNMGAGGSTSGRVKWPGYHVLTSPLEAGKYTVANFLAGDHWIPTGVPFTSGL